MHEVSGAVGGLFACRTPWDQCFIADLSSLTGRKDQNHCESGAMDTCIIAALVIGNLDLSLGEHETCTDVSADVLEIDG